MLWHRTTVSEDLALWIFDNFHWALTHYDRSFWRDPNSLVLPTKDYFTAKRGTDHTAALGVFNDVKRLLGLQDHPVILQPLNVLPDEYTHEYGTTSATNGEYWHDAKNPLITYNPNGMRNPLNFISTLAHELMHAKLAAHIHNLPGGAEAHELATDFHCIIHGFGLIQLQGAADAGWSGYMTQPSRAFATAIFLNLTQSQDRATGALRRREAKTLKMAIKDLKHWDTELQDLTTLRDT